LSWDIMQRRSRKPKESVFTRSLTTYIGGVGLWMAAASLRVFLWALYGAGRYFSHHRGRDRQICCLTLGAKEAAQETDLKLYASDFDSLFCQC
ncbi:MAG TPA: cation-translocating P-type ATPase C-terminal domain-containing protein, partial [Dehalococcoidia bacterium]|nr:cation-translocating P-type ATPase C-terminal domain-containing protein [Dehalococcoidia bacterium]